MSSTPRSPLSRYAVALAAVVLAAVIGSILNPSIGESQPFGPFYGAVILAAWAGGLGPSIAALTLGALAALVLVLPPTPDPGPRMFAQAINVILYFGIGLAIIAFSEANRRARRRLEEADAALREQARLAVYARDIGLAQAEGGPLKTILARCAEAAVRNLNAGAVWIWTIPENGEVLELRAGAGPDPSEIGPNLARLPIDDRPIGRIALRRQPYRTNRLTGDDNVPYPDWASGKGLTAFAGSPLIIDNRLVGAMALFARGELTEATTAAFSKAAGEIAAGIERRRAEERLHRQRQWLRVTLASIGDAVIATDTAGRITFLNAVAEKLTGWSSRDAASRLLDEVFRVVDETTRQPAVNPVRRVLEEGTVVGLTNHSILIARDGIEHPIDDSAAPIRDETSRVAGVVLVFRDVAGRRLAERQVRVSEARKAAILRTALDAIVTIDHQGLVVEWNPAAESIFGYERTQVVGRALGELILPPRARDSRRQGLDRFLTNGDGAALGRRLEVDAIRADGTEFPVELAITRISGEGPPLFTAHLRDITDRRTHERRRNTRLAATQVLAEAESMLQGAPRLLRAICEGLGWDVGGFWTVDQEARILRCREIRQTPGTPVGRFEAVSRALTLAPGVGLPGRVWSTGQPVWIPDVTADPNFPRAEAAVEQGLRSAFAAPIRRGDRFLGVIEFFSTEIQEPDPDLLEMMTTLGAQIGQFLDRRRAEEGLREQTRIAETLHRIGTLLAAELDLERLVQIVTDEATRLTDAQFGAFFHNLVDDRGEAYTLFTISGVPREAFDKFPMPRNTPLFQPTFEGQGAVRLADVTQDPRFGRNAPNHGMPEGHLPVRSYLAVPVTSRSGIVLGGLFFGHPEAGVFTETDERIVTGMAAQAAVAIDNARLYQEIRESEGRFRQFAEHVTDVFRISEPPNRSLVYVSPAYERIWGRSLQSLMDNPSSFLDTVLPADRDRVIDLRLRQEQGQATAEEYRIVRPDGEVRRIWDRAFPILDESGQVVRVVGIAEDITERKRALAERERLVALIEHSRDFIGYADADRRPVYINRAGLKLVGLEGMDETRRFSMLDFFPEKERRQVTEEVFPALHKTGSWDGEGVFRHFGTGQEIPVLRNVFVLPDPETGQPDFYAFVARDITERKKVEQDLAEREERFRQLADAMPQIVWTAGPEGRIDYINRRWYEFAGRSEGPAIEVEEGWRTVLHPEDAAPYRALRDEAVRTGGPFQAECRFWDRAGGEYRWFLGRAVAVRDPEGHILKWYGSWTDIDDRKRAELALQEANRRKNEFLAMLAHELRNPLAPIRNALHLLQRGDEEKQSAEELRGMMQRQVHYINRLVDDLLDMSRIDSGKIELRKERVELRIVLDRAIETSRPLIEDRRHALDVVLPDRPVRLEADPIRLEQVFDNLLNNAAKYTDPGGRIRVEASREGNAAVVRVSDTGIGIEPAMLPKIFDLFVQAERRTDRSQGGLGIGLSLVRNLVEMHGGSVAAHSEGKGRGTEFVVRLPLREEDQTETLETAPPSTSRVRVGDPRTRRILVVDDNEDAADSLARLLARLYRQDVRVAYDGPTALELAPTFRPEVILLDIGLPGLDGYEVARRLRQQPEFAKTLLVAVTGWGQDQDRRLSHEAGFDVHLVKPVDPDAVRDLLIDSDSEMGSAPGPA